MTLEDINKMLNQLEANYNKLITPDYRKVIVHSDYFEIFSKFDPDIMKPVLKKLINKSEYPPKPETIIEEYYKSESRIKDEIDRMKGIFLVRVENNIGVHTDRIKKCETKLNAILSMFSISDQHVYMQAIEWILHCKITNAKSISTVQFDNIVDEAFEYIDKRFSDPKKPGAEYYSKQITKIIMS